MHRFSHVKVARSTSDGRQMADYQKSALTLVVAGQGNDFLTAAGFTARKSHF